MQMIRTALSRFGAQTTARGRAMIVLFAVILLTAFATGEGVLYRLSYFLILGIAGSYALIRLNLWRLDMWMEEQSPVAQVGETLDGSVYVHNNSVLPTGWVEIGQMSDMPGHVCEGATRLPARGWEKWKTEAFCYARGVYTVGPLVARSSDPLGLFRVRRTYGAPVRIIAYPPVVELPYFRLPVADLSGEERVLFRPQARTSQASTIREYDHGDSLNRIHWPSTARCGQLMSKEFDSGRSSGIWIVLDLERENHTSTGMERTDEYSVAIAASLANLALTEERSVGLMAYGDQAYLMPLGDGAGQMSRILEMLALSKTEGDTPLSNVLSENTVKLGRSTSLLVVTASVAPEWVPVLQNLVHHGLGVRVVLVDSMSFGGDQSCYEVAMRLVSAGIPAYVVRRGDSLPIALARPVTVHDLRLFDQYSAAQLTPTCR